MKNQWFISIKKNDEGNLDLSNLHHNYPPKGHYWADPFLYQKDGKDYIFYELYDYKKGVIAYSEIREDMTFTDPTIVLELDYHISYPFLIEDGGELYMVPEIGKKWESEEYKRSTVYDEDKGGYHIDPKNIGIDIYKCVSFPDKWVFEKTLVSGVMAGDSNIFKFNNKYLIFTTINPDMKNQFSLFTSDSLLGPYKYIFGKKITNSRSAGSIFLDEDSSQIIRFTQNSEGGYGRSIFMKSLSLDFSKNKYVEDTLDEIEPNWHPEIFGTHHLDFNKKYIVVDGKRKIDD